MESAEKEGGGSAGTGIGAGTAAAVIGEALRIGEGREGEARVGGKRRRVGC